MPDDYITLEVKDINERIITIPAKGNAIDTEAVGDALKHAGQEGYCIVEMRPIQRDYGSQRDPVIRTLGVEVKLALS